MNRKQALLWLTVAIVGLLVIGTMVCVGGVLITKGLTDRATPPHPPSKSPLLPTQATSTTTPTPSSLRGGPTPSVTHTADALAQSSPIPSNTPKPTNTPAPPTSTSTPRRPQAPAQTPEPPTVSPTTQVPPTPPPSTSTPETPTSSPTPTSQPSNAPPKTTSTPSPTAVIVTPHQTTPTPATEIAGQVVQEGSPVPAGIDVRLEDQNYATIATATTDAQGRYTFDDLAATGSELNIVFAQEWNDQYSTDEVVSWAWLGPCTISAGATEMPDLEIGLMGFEQVSPSAGDSFSAGAISEQSSLVFEWTSYPGASAYWMDLARGDQLSIEWQSSLVDGTSVTFDGTLGDGSPITADTYWWGLGARKDVGQYQLTVYGYLTPLLIKP